MNKHSRTLKPYLLCLKVCWPTERSDVSDVGSKTSSLFLSVTLTCSPVDSRFIHSVHLPLSDLSINQLCFYLSRTAVRFSSTSFFNLQLVTAFTVTPFYFFIYLNLILFLYLLSLHIAPPSLLSAASLSSLSLFLHGEI